MASSTTPWRAIWAAPRPCSPWPSSAEGAVNIREERFASRDFASFDAVLAQFLQGYDKPIGCACFGLAGPTDGQRAKLTYLPWEIDGPLLAKRHRINRVLLVNDFAAAAHGLDGLGGGGLLTLRRGVPRGQAPGSSSAPAPAWGSPAWSGATNTTR